MVTEGLSAPAVSAWNLTVRKAGGQVCSPTCLPSPSLQPGGSGPSSLFHLQEALSSQGTGPNPISGDSAPPSLGSQGLLQCPCTAYALPSEGALSPWTPLLGQEQQGGNLVDKTTHSSAFLSPGTQFVSIRSRISHSPCWFGEITSLHACVSGEEARLRTYEDTAG